MASLEWYRTFVAVYQEGTATAAAERLFMTQPGVSGHVAALEGATGERLFARASRRMVPTEAGKALYSRVADAVERLEAVERVAAGRAAPDLPLVRLGAPLDWALGSGLAGLVGLPARLQLRFGDAVPLLDALGRGELDAVVSTVRPAGQDVERVQLLEEAFWLVAPAGTEPPAESSGPGYAAWLAERPWVSYGPELPIIRRFWRGAFGARPPFEPRWVVPSLNGALEAVRLGVGVSLLPDYLCAGAVAAGAVVRLPTEPVVANVLYVAWERKRRWSPEVLAVLERLLPPSDGVASVADG